MFRREPEQSPPAASPLLYDEAKFRAHFSAAIIPKLPKGPFSSGIEALTLHTVMQVGALVKEDRLSKEDGEYLALGMRSLDELKIPAQIRDQEEYDLVNIAYYGRDILAYGTGERRGKADIVIFSLLHNALPYSHTFWHPEGRDYPSDPKEWEKVCDVNYFNVSGRLPFNEELAPGAYGSSVNALEARVVLVFGWGNKDVRSEHVMHPNYLLVQEGCNFRGHCFPSILIHRDYAENLVAFYKERGIFAPIVPLLDVAPARAENPDYTPMGKGLTRA